MTVRQLLAAERSDIVATLKTLSEDEWAAPSLCVGWTVKDVAAHIAVDAFAPSAATAALIRHRFSVARVNDDLVTQARGFTTQQVTERLESTIGTGMLARLMPRTMLGDAVVHHQDILRPLGRSRTIPAERLQLALNHPDPFSFPSRLTRGLRFVATDVAWEKGAGPEVRGTGEALALTIMGRPVALDELEGDGVAALRLRVLAH